MKNKILKTLGITAQDVKAYLASLDNTIRYAGQQKNSITYTPLHTEILIKGDAMPVIIHHARSGNNFSYWSRKIEIRDVYKRANGLHTVDLLEWHEEGKTEDKDDLINFLKSDEYSRKILGS